jgi:hypothetical protein
MDPAAAAAAAAPRGAFPAVVQPISLWALVNTAIVIAIMLHSGGVDLTLTATKQSAALGRSWMQWCAAAQAAAAGLALLLPAGIVGRRSRMFLASAALAATYVNHLMYGWLVDQAVVADPAGTPPPPQRHQVLGAGRSHGLPDPRER